MKKIFKVSILTLAMTGVMSQAKALDINLLNINLGSPEANKISQLYGNAYGFPPEQVAPALSGPAEEVPAILRIAQAAGTIPASVWMMRKMGMSYGRILETFTLGPAALFGGGVGSPSGNYPSPGWSRLTNPYYVELARVYFLRDILKVNPANIFQIPPRGVDFTRALLFPYQPGVGYWLPPGQAKKLGLWMPPGQAKKIGFVNPLGYPSVKNGKEWKSEGEDKWEKKGKGHGGPFEISEKGHGKGKGK